MEKTVNFYLKKCDKNVNLKLVAEYEDRYAMFDTEKNVIVYLMKDYEGNDFFEQLCDFSIGIEVGESYIVDDLENKRPVKIEIIEITKTTVNILDLDMDSFIPFTKRYKLEDFSKRFVILEKIEKEK